MFNNNNQYLIGIKRSQWLVVMVLSFYISNGNKLNDNFIFFKHTFKIATYVYISHLKSSG